MNWKTLMLVTGLTLAAAPAGADWDENDPQKWVQYPDLTVYGVDVNASNNLPGVPGFILADDFECTEAGAVTGIHIWGSWLWDYLPQGFDPRAVSFTLSFHEDIPESASSTGFSMPGSLLWYMDFQPGEFVVRVWRDGIEEGWMTPPDNYTFPADSVCWQYNFTIDAADAFYQHGSPDAPMVYWLDVQATPEDEQARFGWKTSPDHWNDAAVCGRGSEPYAGPWEPLKYPTGHELWGQPIDLAFVLVGEEGPTDLDFGDAPDGAAAPRYPTYLINNGARHVIGGPWFGDDNDDPDAEGDGQPDPDAKGDDNDGNDDEDGVSIPALTLGQPATITFEVNGGGGNVAAWIDFDASDSWEVSEQVYSGWVADGTHAFNITCPVTAAVGQTFARFRITSSAVVLLPDGAAPDGEVEDHEVWIYEEQEEWDFGDAPILPGGGGYRTLLAQNGARHLIVAGSPWLGDLTDGPDAELDGQPDPSALGDDTYDSNDDEDGVVIPPTLVIGLTTDITVEVNGPGGVLEAWIDFDGDRTWSATELVHAGWLPAGTHTIPVTPPYGSVAGQTFGRFRISTAGGLSPVGAALDGEVEDHEVWLEEWQTRKWIQRPDLTPYGIDVHATYPYLLADDFRCTEPGYITEVCAWASWRNDYLPFGEDPEAVGFTLSFHEDIPDSLSPTGYSMPGDVKWYRDFEPRDFSARVWKRGIEEGWLVPPDAYDFPADSVCWFYTFKIPEGEAFRQEGTQDQPIVYWLDLQARPDDPEAYFGWKTSRQHWNDDACWATGTEPYSGSWGELVYPPNHELYGQSIDLAFIIKHVSVTDAMDDVGMPSRFGLEQNVPNPFNPSTEILYAIPSEGRVTLEIYDVQGCRVRTLVDAEETAGAHTVIWNGRDASGVEVPTGVYFCRLVAGELEDTRKMLLLK